jgi:GDPmannose 4,6-dehydratase|tara:strand:- start:653 stop:1762 length:1110 start_codon:yes stop_codon:yes gene_type:complete
MRTALIFGVTGQDGSYLSEFLLGKGYRVVGVYRRSSVDTTERLRDFLENPNFELMCGDIVDSGSVYNIVDNLQPDECYNLAAQSHVGVSFEQPEATFLINAVGPLNILEAIRRRSPDTRFYQASTSEMFGDNYTEKPKPIDATTSLSNTDKFQDEDTAFAPRSPYAVAKVAAHNLVHTYREAYGLHATCGILFNHESERRGENFVTRKITKYVAGLKCLMDDTGVKDLDVLGSHRREVLYWDNQDGQEVEIKYLELGNIDSHRDWGHAADYVRGMWLMVQEESPRDYVLATGSTHSVREFLDAAFKSIGVEDWSKYVVINPKFFRPAEVDYLKGNPAEAETALKWTRDVSFDDLARRMVESDIQNIRNE